MASLRLTRPAHCENCRSKLFISLPPYSFNSVLCDCSPALLSYVSLLTMFSKLDRVTHTLCDAVRLPTWSHVVPPRKFPRVLRHSLGRLRACGWPDSCKRWVHRAALQQTKHPSESLGRVTGR